MTDKKQPKARIPHFDNERFKQALGETTINDYLSGAIYDLIDGEAGAEYYEMVAELRELRGKTSELDGRIERLDAQIEELQARCEELAQERDEKEERMAKLEDELAEAETTSNEAVETTTEEVASELLVAVAENELGTNGVVSGLDPVQKAALRCGSDPNDVIREMRHLAQPARESDNLAYIERPLERGFLVSDQNKQNRLSEKEFDAVRRAIAGEVLSEDEVDSERVPERRIDV